MCVVSMVFDHYGDRFRPWLPNFPPVPHTFPPAPMIVPTVDEGPAVRKMIEDFWKALEAAKKVDSLTAQPDCEDPEKAKLVERVAVLEKELAALKGKRTRKRKSP